jgi:hypothetical protein
MPGLIGNRHFRICGDSPAPPVLRFTFDKADISVLIRFAESIGDNALAETTDGTDIMNHQKHFSGAHI